MNYIVNLLNRWSFQAINDRRLFRHLLISAEFLRHTLFKNGNKVKHSFKNWMEVKLSTLFKIDFKIHSHILKVDNRNNRTRCEICSKLTPCSKLTYFTPCSGISTANFEQVNSGWVANDALRNIPNQPLNCQSCNHFFEKVNKLTQSVRATYAERSFVK